MALVPEISTKKASNHSHAIFIILFGLLFSSLIAAFCHIIMLIDSSDTAWQVIPTISMAVTIHRPVSHAIVSENRFDLVNHPVEVGSVLKFFYQPKGLAHIVRDKSVDICT